jgi:FdhD protein
MTLVTSVRPSDEDRIQAGSVDHAGTSFASGRAAEERSWKIAEEVPVALVYNQRPYMVGMATPADLDEFGLGFSLSEGVIENAAEMRRAEVTENAQGAAVAMRIPPARMTILKDRKRAMESRSSCGICGIEAIEEAIRPPRPVTIGFEFRPEAVAAGFAALKDHQPINRLAHSLHAAAWCSPAGEIILAREDVGRHNALDKMIGACARQGVDFSTGFALLSSRCSFELVQKAAYVGIPVLANVSAPTSLALDLAQRAGMILACRGRGDEVMVFK